jgi:tetratricopeptide (TPR) repeat protein
LVTAIVVELAGPAWAETPEEQVEHLAAEAVNAYRSADYLRAIEVLERAYQIRQFVELLFDEGKAYEKLGNIDRALDCYRRVSHSTDADNRLRSKAEGRITAIEQQRARIAPPAVHETRPAPDLVVPVPPKGTTLAPPPDHGAPPPASLPPRAPAPMPAKLRADAAAARLRARGVGIGFVSLGGGALATAVGLSISTYKLHQQFATQTDLSEIAKRSVRDNAQTQALVADIMYGVAAAAVGASAYFLSVGYRKEKGASESKRVAVAPWMAPIGAGVMVRGRF